MLKTILTSNRIEAITVFFTLFIVTTSLNHPLHQVEEKKLSVEDKVDLFVNALSVRASKSTDPGEFPTINLFVPVGENTLKNNDKLFETTKKYVRFLEVLIQATANEFKYIKFYYTLHNSGHVYANWCSSLWGKSQEGYKSLTPKTLNDSLALFVDVLNKSVTYDYKIEPGTLMLTVKNFKKNEFSVYGAHFLNYADAVARLGYVLFMREHPRFKKIAIKFINPSPVQGRGPFVYCYLSNSVQFSDLTK